MTSKQNPFPSHLNDFLINIGLLLVQAYGLLFLNWSGLYVIYLIWIDLFLLTVYTYFRNEQYKELEQWKVFRQNNERLFDKDKDVFILIRVMLMSVYFILIVFSAIPYEQQHVELEEYIRLATTETKPSTDFWDSVFIQDPVFIVSVLFIISYYLKQLISKPDTSKRGMLEFSFNLASKDPRYLAPFFALLTGFVPVVIAFLVTTEGHRNSYLFVYALWLMAIRFLIDWIMYAVVDDELKKEDTLIN